MEIFVGPAGEVHLVYSELVDLRSLGQPTIRRASHVEPDEAGNWWADLAPVAGPRLGPYRLRSQALDAELSWLGQHLGDVVQQH